MSEKKRARIEIYQTANGEWYWVLSAERDWAAKSDRMYSTHWVAKRAALRAQRLMATAEMEK